MKQARFELRHTEPTTDARTGDAFYYVYAPVRSSYRVVELGTGVNGRHEGRYFVQKWVNEGWATVLGDVLMPTPDGALLRALEVLGHESPVDSDLT